jgi:DDE superfamily endonuclease
MEDVLEVYQRPYDPLRPLVCLDELGKQLLTTPRGALPLQTGQVRCEDYEYARHGTCNLFMAVEPLRGFRRVWATARRTKLDFAEVLRQLVDEFYPQANQIVLVTDNLNTHSVACLYERFTPAEARRIASKLE